MTFTSESASQTTHFRSIILFGQNVASYKFALGRSLLELAAAGAEAVTLEELAAPFSHHLCNHIAEVPTQGQFAHSRFLDACRYFNADQINHDELITATANLGFRNVIDAFHVVSGEEVPTRFFMDERTTSTSGIRLTEDLQRIAASTQSDNLVGELEGRWNLVERAWESKADGEPLLVLYDVDRELLVPALQGHRRPLTEARLALNGYQKGHCFYCYQPILVVPNSPAPADVDHVFPHSLMARGLPMDLDQVWNLVLACAECNRGTNGKFAAIPAEEYVEQLWLRNEYLIWSHHPLRQTLIAQVGATGQARRQYLKRVLGYADVLNMDIAWRPPDRGSLPR